MLIRISDDNKLILESVISENYMKGFCDNQQLYLKLEKGHLIIVSNDRRILKVKRYKHKLGELVQTSVEKSIKRKPMEFEGMCIDLNLQEDPNKKNKEKEKR